MDRKEFLSLLGLSTAGIVTACLGACQTTDSTIPTAGNVDFTLDLTATANKSLKTKGGYLVTNGVIVALTTAGNYIAVSAYCTHEGSVLSFSSSGTSFYCLKHGATFNATGSVTGGPAKSSLTVYKTTLSGNSLRVYSA